jgi:ABC-2 type transport system ATP-binding protein
MADNLAFYGRIWRLDSRQLKSRAQELLGRMDLWERRDDRVSALSRGMRQKLAIARALLHRPALLLLDEPTAGLDVVAANAIRDQLAALAAHEGVTIFLTTHNMVEAERLCHQVAVIREGRLLAVGAPDELRARGRGERLCIEGRGIDPSALEAVRSRPEVASADAQDGQMTVILRQGHGPARLISLLVRRGVEVEEVRRDRASLEDVFLTLVEEADRNA